MPNPRTPKHCLPDLLNSNVAGFEAMARILLAIVLSSSLLGCANPLNQVTSDRYAAECSEAERNGNLPAAEELCYRALVNVDGGNLGPELKSQRLYNLARIKRRVEKFTEAADLLNESLSLEEKFSGPNSLTVGRRLAELAANLAALGQWQEGVPLVERLLPIAERYSGGERMFVAELLRRYADEATALGNLSAAGAFRAKAKVLAPEL